MGQETHSVLIFAVHDFWCYQGSPTTSQLDDKTREAIYLGLDDSFLLRYTCTYYVSTCTDYQKRSSWRTVHMWCNRFRAWHILLIMEATIPLLKVRS